MPNVASFDNEPKPKKKKEKKKSKGKNSPAATPADDNDELTESDDPSTTKAAPTSKECKANRGRPRSNCRVGGAEDEPICKF